MLPQQQSVGEAGAAPGPYLPKVLYQDLHHDVLELDVHHGSHSVLLCSHEGGPEDHPHVGR